MAQQQLQDIIADGEWLAHRYDAEHDCYQMRHLTRDAHDAAAFITDDYLGIEEKPVILDRKQAIAAGSHDNPFHFILHSAFCASTMLARGFNLPGVSMGLKEPVLLNDITGYRRRGAAPAAVAERLDHGLTMLSRPLGSDRAIIIKPSNVFNALAPLALTMRPQAKAVLLYAPLPVFLVSVARKGIWCRIWCRELLEGLITDGIVNLGFEPRDYFRLSDLQVAAVGWLAQHMLFRQMADKFGAERIATLDSERLTADPEATVKAAALHYGIDTSGVQFRDHPAFATHSKNGGKFSSKDRQEEHSAARAAYGDEVEMVQGWAEKVAENAGVSLDLPFALR